MSAIAGVLLVPEAGDPWGLCVPGAMGAMPPTAWLHATTWGRVTLRGRPMETALVLAWQDAVVREGRDRAAYVLAEREGAYSDPGPRWSYHSAMACWFLGHDEGMHRGQGFAPRGGGGVVNVPELAAPPEVSNVWLHGVVALATVCAARGLGRVVLVDADGREVRP